MKMLGHDAVNTYTGLTTVALSSADLDEAWPEIATAGDTMDVLTWNDGAEYSTDLPFVARASQCRSLRLTHPIRMLPASLRQLANAQH